MGKLEQKQEQTRTREALHEQNRAETPTLPQPQERERQPASRRGEVLRYHGLMLDQQSGVVRWRERELPLREEERETLGVVLERAGQILSRPRLAGLLGVGLDTVDSRLFAVNMALTKAGVRCHLRRAAGVGYVLWP